MDKIPPAFVQARLDYLERMSDGIVNPKLRLMCRKVIEDPRFIKCPAAKTRHQAYAGGLVVHTAEVLEASLHMSISRHLKVNYDVLVAAVVFHDYGKIWDYKQVTTQIEGFEVSIAGEYDYTSHQDKIRHLPRSYADFLHMNATVTVEEFFIDDETVENICHCILAHHGRKEWGSPVEPKTTEAYIIHFADMLSANCALDVYKV